MPESQGLGVSVGQRVSVTKTISESDVYLFAGITGDLHPNHVDEEYMKAGRFGGRIVHGVLLVGLMSAASTKFCLDNGIDSVSLGYDRVRFIAPVHFGDTVTIDYTIGEIDGERRRTVADITATNQSHELVAVAKHVMKYVR